jgi:hypothetical protein
MERARHSRPFRRATVSALLFALTISAWAISGERTMAHAALRQRAAGRVSRSDAQQNGVAASRVPSPVRFREVSGRGLIVRVWVNDEGPFDFAVDTGAGSTILSTRVAQAARVAVAANRTINLSGLSGARGVAREAAVRSVAVGDARNYLPGRGSIIVADSLPPDLDGVLDPSESFYPLGYAIDFQEETLRAFDPRVEPLSRRDVPTDGDVVAWLTDGATRRPFVSLEGGRRALIDTGSGLGLGLTPEAARSLGVAGGRSRERDVNDLGRGRVGTSRIEPATVRVGSLVLRGVPTDLLSGASNAAPIILGRDALRPFVLTFDPSSRLIRIAPR